MALWGLLGPRGVDVFAWESFGGDWVIDITNELNLEDRRVFQAAYGDLPDLGKAAPDRDVVLPGTERLLACGCRTRIGLPTIGVV